MLHAAIPLENFEVTDQLAEELKERVITSQQSDSQLAFRSAELALDLGELTGVDAHLALGLRLVAQTYLICFGEGEKAREFYDRAIALYEKNQDELGRAETAITHVWALATEGRYEDAVREGNWAFGVFEQRGEVRSLGSLLQNLALIHHREGRMRESYELNVRAGAFYEKLGPEGDLLRTTNLINQAGMLNDLGRYSEAILTFEKAIDRAAALGSVVLLARARQNLAFTYQVLGWYNRALLLLERAREGWVQDHRDQEIQQVDYLIGNCLLHLGRFEEAILIFQKVRQGFEARGSRYEAARLHLKEARAEIGLGELARALESILQGKQLYIQLDNRYEAARADLLAAGLHYQSGSFEESIELSLASRAIFSEGESVSDAAISALQAGRASLGKGDLSNAEKYAREAQQFTSPRGLIDLNYQIDYLLGQVARAQNDPETAAGHFRNGIEALEQIQGRMLTEYRPDFLEAEHKSGLFESAISLALKTGRVLEGFELVQRAKSRALFDILAHQIDLQIRARSPGDTPLIDEFNRLVMDRNALRRRADRAQKELNSLAGPEEEKDLIEKIEKDIEELRRRLLVRHADYLEPLESHPVQEINEQLSNLDPGTAILDFYALEEQPVVFIASAKGPRVKLTAHSLGIGEKFIKDALSALRTNFSALAYGSPRHRGALTRQAKSLLTDLHDLLLGPILSELQEFEQIIIAPHGLLHYLPFHALSSGDRYLIEKFRVSYLPSASFWKPSGQTAAAVPDTVAVGCSNNGKLPYSIAEAQSIARLWEAKPILEQDATRENVQQAMAKTTLFHCASHAEFRPDSPLFSGIELFDASLTTLDIFNLKLETSLVTLSACNTGMNVIGGGDELLGFIRAFLAAGAKSLVLSHWEVEDRSTSLLMQRFYQGLQAGLTKSAALQAAQIAFINGEYSTDEADYRHPFYWASFYLVGQTGPL